MKIIGNTVGTPLPKPNWNQNDPTKGDYIKNKPFGEEADGAIKTLDEQYIPDSIARTSDVDDKFSTLVGDTPVSTQINDAISGIDTEVSWNELLDKPFETIYSNTLTWNGNTEGLEVVSHDDLGTLYKVSDVDATTYMVENGFSCSDKKFGDSYEYTPSEVKELYETVGTVGTSLFVVAPTDNYNFMDVVTFPSKGIWFIYDEANNEYCTSLTIPNSNIFEVGVKPLDEKFIPDSIARVEEVMAKTNPTGTGSLSLNRAPETTVGDYSVAEGLSTEASGFAAHAEGYYTIASGYYAHAEGQDTKATNYNSHAEGQGSQATASCAHAEGSYTEASEAGSHAEGSNTKATGYSSHAEGSSTVASNNYTHAEGQETEASGWASHAEGYKTKSSGYCSHAEGAYAEATNDYAHAEGYETEATGSYSHAEGSYTKATQYYTHAEGYYTEATNQSAHAEGEYSKAMGSYSHAEGRSSEAKGSGSHAEGKYTKAYGEASHAEGNYTEATEYCTHAEGDHTKATADFAHAEGQNVTAGGMASHAEGYYATTEGMYSHAEGSYTAATADSAHAEGSGSKAQAAYSHAEGEYTIAASPAQHVQGKYNIVDDAEVYAHIVGNGHMEQTDSGDWETIPSNAHTLDWDGNAWFAGDVTVGADAKKLATEESVNVLAALVGDTSVATQISNAIANHYTKAEIDAMEFITIADIDAICGGVTTETILDEAILGETTI